MIAPEWHGNPLFLSVEESRAATNCRELPNPAHDPETEK